MWSWAENNETKQGKVNYFLRWNIMAKSKKVKNGQLYPGISDFTTNLNIPDVPPSNTASFGHLWKSYLASHFSMTIHTFYGQCTSLKAINNCSQKRNSFVIIWHLRMPLPATCIYLWCPLKLNCKSVETSLLLLLVHPRKQRSSVMLICNIAV